LILRLFAAPIATVFGVSGDLLKFTSHILQVQTFFMPISGMQMLTGNYFQSTGRPLKVTGAVFQAPEPIADRAEPSNKQPE
jgi:Na+-driven multidrug efflux pump